MYNDREGAERNARAFRALDADLFGEEYADQIGVYEDPDAKYLEEDFAEVDAFFRDGLYGESRAPAQLLIHLYEERKLLRTEVRRRMKERENKRLREGTEVPSDS